VLTIEILPLLVALSCSPMLVVCTALDSSLFLSSREGVGFAAYRRGRQGEEGRPSATLTVIRYDCALMESF